MIQDVYSSLGMKVMVGGLILIPYSLPEMGGSLGAFYGLLKGFLKRLDALCRCDQLLGGFKAVRQQLFYGSGIADCWENLTIGRVPVVQVTDLRSYFFLSENSFDVLGDFSHKGFIDFRNFPFLASGKVRIRFFFAGSGFPFGEFILVGLLR